MPQMAGQDAQRPELTLARLLTSRACSCATAAGPHRRCGTPPPLRDPTAAAFALSRVSFASHRLQLKEITECRLPVIFACKCGPDFADFEDLFAPAPEDVRPPPPGALFSACRFREPAHPCDARAARHATLVTCVPRATPPL
eukprot:1832208-Prymnesium_polylepis.2